LTSSPVHVVFLRKKKAMHKSVSNDDKRLQSVLKKMGMNTIPGIQEVNIFHSDSVTQFVNPKGRVFTLHMEYTSS